MEDPSIALAQTMAFLRMTGMGGYILGFFVIGLIGSVIGLFRR